MAADVAPGVAGPVKRDDFFPGQLIGGAPAHDGRHIALLDELAILRPNYRPCAKLDHRPHWASYSGRRLGCGCGVSAARAACLRCGGHPVGAGRL
jgi:hypothetical protein